MDKKEQIEKAAYEHLENEKTEGKTTKGEEQMFIQGFLQCAEWALSQPKEPKKEVDLEELINYIENESEIAIPVNELMKDGNHITKKEYGIVLLKHLCIELRDKFKPHLQKTVESDAVEFAEWMGNNWVKLNDKGWMKDDLYTTIEATHTTQELYEQFKQLKKW